MAKKMNGKKIIPLIGLAVVIIGCVMAIAKTYFILPNEVAHQAKDFAEMKDEVGGIDARVDLVEDVVSIIQNDLNYIRGDIAEQKELSKEILREIRK